jgi:tryptophanyl-tRNA synthetase
MSSQPSSLKKRVLSGMRPTGKLHLGNFVGALDNWVQIQKKYQSHFFIADWHALTTDYADTSQIQVNTQEVMIDFLAAGLDPKESVIFLQSHVPEHAELHLLLSQTVPLGWLERVPTYKEQRENLRDRDLGTYGFLGYPVLQSADILLYRADFVPVGEDQVAHLEITREITRRFNSFYGPLFPEPQPLLTASPRLPGTDGRKMSKSFGNAIFLSDSEADVRKKTSVMITDPARKRKTDPGNPDVCPVFAFHKLVSPQSTIDMVNTECRRAGIGCVEDKKMMAENLLKYLVPIQDRRREYEKNPEMAWDILEDGSRRARAEAEETMQVVRSAMNLSRTSRPALSVKKSSAEGVGID